MVFVFKIQNFSTKCSYAATILGLLSNFFRFNLGNTCTNIYFFFKVNPMFLNFSFSVMPLNYQVLYSCRFGQFPHSGDNAEYVFFQQKRKKKQLIEIFIFYLKVRHSLRSNWPKNYYFLNSYSFCKVCMKNYVSKLDFMRWESWT